MIRNELQIITMIFLGLSMFSCQENEMVDSLLTSAVSQQMY